MTAIARMIFYSSWRGESRPYTTQNGETMHTAMSTTEIFLIAMMLIFTIPYLIWRVGKTEYYAPLVVVQIITGILLGPGILGAAFPDYYAFVFNPTVIQSLNGIAWWGSDGFCLDRRYRVGSAKGMGTSPGKRHHRRAGTGDAAAVRLHRRCGNVDV